MDGRMMAMLAAAGALVVGAAAQEQATTAVHYRLETTAASDLGRLEDSQIAILEKLNRADREHLPRLRQIVMPDQWVTDENAYSPMPMVYPSSAPLPKALVVALDIQAFAGYEHGRLVRWGPVSTGARGRTTDAGRLALNWKSPGRNSTVNPDWFMKWYFNIRNAEGVAFHAYALPGRPASHGCIRLLERDAVWVFNWGDEWTLDRDGRLERSGTPVLVFGRYDFDLPAPWLDVTAMPAPIALPDFPDEMSLDDPAGLGTLK